MTMRWSLGFVLAVLLLQTACTSTSQPRDDADLEQASELYSELGLAYLRQGDIPRAEAKLKKALELDKNNGAAHHYMAEVYKRMDDPEYAEKHYKLAVKLNTEDSMLLNNYGAFLCSQARFDDAETYFLKAALVHRNRTPELAYENMALCAMRSAKPDKAKEYFRKALSIKPDMPKSLFNMAQLSYNLGENLQARAFLQRLHDQVGKTKQSVELAIKVERARGDEVAAARLQKELQSMAFPAARSVTGQED